MSESSNPTAQLIDLTVRVQQIAAPTGEEERRAAWVARYLRELGIGEVESDSFRNVYARIPGRQRRPALMVSAHTDTVFPMEVDLALEVADQGRRIIGPGIGDNSAGVASLLWLAEQLHRGAPPPVDIWLVANTGEEGLGDLRGMRGAVDKLQSLLGACVVIEGMGLSRIVHQALGSRRFRIAVTAPGGHSWSDFGSPSAIHFLVHLADELSRLKAPVNPRTTFNIGRIGGGTSVNTIAQQAWLELDLRSEDAGALRDIVAHVHGIVARFQSARLRNLGVQVTVETIGDRPAGEIANTHPLVQAAEQSLQQVGVPMQTHLRISSTDANIPLSRGIPAVCIGVTDGGNAHRLDEWILTEPLAAGARHLRSVVEWSAGWLAGG